MEQWEGSPETQWQAGGQSDMTHEVDLPEQIQTLLREKLLISVESRDFDIVEAEMLDSLAFTQLLMELTEQFGFNAPMEEMDIDDFRSVNAISQLVAENIRAGQAA